MLLAFPAVKPAANEPPPAPVGTRALWTDVPARTRRRIETLLGAGVVTAHSQSGGFSPGLAERLLLADGRRVFLKAAGALANARTPGIHALETQALAAIPDSFGLPRLLGALDEQIDGERWVVLVIEDIDGRHPHLPWQEREITGALDAFAALARAPLPESVQLPALADGFAADIARWARYRNDPPPGLDAWVAAHLDELIELSTHARRALAGDHLVHGDARSDNLLRTPGGHFRVVDWPYANRGVRWFDSLTLLMNVRPYGTDVEPHLDRVRELGASERDIDVVLSVLLAYFIDATGQPAPPGLPTLRAFQAAQQRVLTDWLIQRLGR